MSRISRRIRIAEAKLADSSDSNSVAQYYLRVFLDAHQPLYLNAAVWRPDVTLAEITDAGVLPERQQASTLPCHTLFPNHLPHAVLVQPDKTRSRIARCLLKAVHSHTGARTLSTHADVVGFATACIKASILGNYMHARLPPGRLATLHARAMAVRPSRIKRHFDAMVVPALLEYISAVAPLSSIAPNWAHFTATAIAAADQTIRGVVTTTTTTALPSAAAPQQDEYPPSTASSSSHNEPYQSWGILARAPTGHRRITVCTKCATISANIVNPPRGFHPVSAIVNPFGRPHDPDPVTHCEVCATRHTRVEMHGIFLCVRPGCTIVACPGCNHIHAFSGPIVTTLCYVCCHNEAIVARLQPELGAATLILPAHRRHPEAPARYTAPLVTIDPDRPVPHCYADEQPIPRTAQVFRQHIIDPDADLLFSLPACQYHHDPRVIISSGYSAVVQEKKLD